MNLRRPQLNQLASRERYLWLWRQLQELDQRIQRTFAQAPPPQASTAQQLWIERLRLQLRRLWP